MLSESQLKEIQALDFLEKEIFENPDLGYVDEDEDEDEDLELIK